MTPAEEGGIARERYYGDDAGDILYPVPMDLNEKLTVDGTPVVTADDVPDEAPAYLATHDAYADGPDA